MAAILEREPDWRLLPAATPASVRRLLQRCLEKDVEQTSARHRRCVSRARRRHRPIREPIASGTIPRFRSRMAMGWRLVAESSRARRWRWSPACSGATRGAASGHRRSVHPTFTQITSQSGLEWFPSLSPDGKWVVYGGDADGNRDIFLQSTTGQTPINLTADSTDDDDQPAFSPDGERIAFRSSRDGGGIFVMGRTGEAVRRLTRRGFRPTWSPDGRETRVHDRERRPGSAEHARAELVVGRQRGVWRRTATRKRRRRIAKLVAARAPHCLHDERRDRGQYAAGYLDRRSLRRESGCGHHGRCAGTGIPCGRPTADISISSAVVAGRSICGACPSTRHQGSRPALPKR